MIRVKAKLQSPRIDLQKFRTRMDAQGLEILARSMFTYVVTAQSLIPVWTGASQSTLLVLAQMAGAPLAIIPSNTVNASFAAKEQARGRAHSGASLRTTNSIYSFSFDTDLPHLVYNEYNNANVDRPPEIFSKAGLINPGPYNFQSATKDAVTTILKEFRIPDPRDNQTIKRITIR